MKKLKSYVKNLYISLDDINENLKEKIQNLDGLEISECCRCEYPEDVPECEPCKCCEPTTINQFGKFNSNAEVTRELDSNPKVQTLYNIWLQFGNYHYREYDHTLVEPLYFGNDMPIVANAPVTREMGDMPQQEADPMNVPIASVPTRYNKKIHDFIIDTCITLELEMPVIQSKINGEVQVHTLFHTGTNGKENSIKSSLEKTAKLLGKLESKSEIKWAQVLDVAIDNLDDVYTFYITFVLDIEKLKQEIKTNKIK